MNEPSALLEGLPEEAVWRLEEACCRFEAAWQAGARPRPEDFLAGAAGDERLALLRELLRLEVYYRRRAGEGPSAADYQARFPKDTAVLQEVFASTPGPGGPPAPRGPEAEDPERTGPELLPPTTDEGHAGVNGNGQVPRGRGDATPGRYRRLRFHAAGNLGEVSVAEDTELHREVALKEIKQEHAGRPESRGRFVLEAEVTGRLEHPGIVPVYGLGAHADGRPYYAMRFVRGDTLAEAIARFHGRAPVRFDALEFRGLLGRFVGVCQAVAYAHSRGVLHRDLKPGNIMLGEFGETLVVDWGLAKVAGRPGVGGAVPDEEGGLRPRGDGWAATVAGSVVGTPAFMSPEQARGEGEGLGPAADVYSLGATLYALLTNRPPFRGKVAEVLAQVQRGAWVPARQVNPAVPAALDAICRRAMALEPQERYASALELAGEVEHWLADEPVAAYREPAGARLRRWVRKHPRKVTAAGVLLLAAVVGLTAGTVLLERSKRQAEENFQITRKAVHQFLVAVNEEQLLDEPGMQELRVQLLKEALDYYKEFLDKRPGDPVVRQERAEAYRQLGEVYRQMGRPEAKPLVQQSLEGFNDLRERAPADPEVGRGLARSYLALANVLVQSGEPEEGRDHAGRAIQILESLRAESPNDRPLLTLLGRAYDARATAQAHLGLLEEARPDGAQAVKFLDEAVLIMNDEPTSGRSATQINPLQGPADRRGEWTNFILLDRAWINEGLLLKRAGRKAAAGRPLLWAATIARGLQRRAPRLGRLRNGLALALCSGGHVEVEFGRPGRGEPALWEALGWSRRLINDDPLDAEYRATHAQAAGFLGEDLFLSGQTEPAAEWLREAVRVADGLPKGKGKDRALLTHRARFLWVLGCLEGELGHPDSGLRYCGQARQEQERLLAQAPRDRSLRSEWLGTREAIARLRFRAGKDDADACIREQRQILAEREALAGRGPVLPYFQREVGASAAVLAGLLLEKGQAREALAVVEKVLPAHEELVQADRLVTRLKARTNAPPQEERIRSLILLAPYPTEFPRHPEPEDYQLRRVWAELLARKGAALARTGQGAAAGACVRQAIEIAEELARGDGYFTCPPCSWPGLWSTVAEQLQREEPCYLYDLACHLALAATLPGKGGGDAGDRALAALRAYGAAGFDNVHKLRTDPRLAPLRGRADFQRLVRELEIKPPVRKGPPSPGTARGVAGPAPRQRP